MKRKFNKAAKAAIRAYYDGRNAAKKISDEGGSHEPIKAAWDKNACLDAISNATCRKRGSGIRQFTACAGTFWFRWSDGVTTEHNENNWYRMKKHDAH